LLANAVSLVCRWRLDKCIRQQAGSYRSSVQIEITVAFAFAVALAVAVLLISYTQSPDTAKRAFGAGHIG
jgi:hypothetical protein